MTPSATSPICMYPIDRQCWPDSNINFVCTESKSKCHLGLSMPWQTAEVWWLEATNNMVFCAAMMHCMLPHVHNAQATEQWLACMQPAGISSWSRMMPWATNLQKDLHCTFWVACCLLPCEHWTQDAPFPDRSPRTWQASFDPWDHQHSQPAQQVNKGGVRLA